MFTNTDLSSVEGRKKHYNCMDLFKFLCAILVVTIHTNPFLDINKYVNYGLASYIARIAVPFYFVCSGYLLFRKTDKNNFDKSITVNYMLRILKLYIIWTVIYLIPSIYSNITKSKHGMLGAFFGYIRNIFMTGSIGHLWYLNALIVAVFAITVLLVKKVKIRNIIVLGVVLYVIGLLGQSYFGILKLLSGNEFIWKILHLISTVMVTTRNGVFEGILFVGIGMLFAYKKIIIKPKLAIIGFVASMLVGFIEVFGLKKINFIYQVDMFVFFIPAVFFLFYISTHIELKDSGIYKYLREVGILIFYTHKWFKFIVEGIEDVLSKLFEIDKVNSLINFFIILLLSFAVSITIIELAKKEKFKFLRKIY